MGTFPHRMLKSIYPDVKNNTDFRKENGQSDRMNAIFAMPPTHTHINENVLHTTI